jgi:hypothetical protein
VNHDRTILAMEKFIVVVLVGCVGLGFGGCGLVDRILGRVDAGVDAGSDASVVIEDAGLTVLTPAGIDAGL